MDQLQLKTHSTVEKAKDNVWTTLHQTSSEGLSDTCLFCSVWAETSRCVTLNLSISGVVYLSFWLKYYLF